MVHRVLDPKCSALLAQGAVKVRLNAKSEGVAHA